MITLNKERGFESIESWDEIQELAGFTDNLDPEQHELNEIIGNYLFKDRIACGLSNCHQPHGRGYIVSTRSGLVTNIGNVCGKNHFGVEFTQLAKAHNRAQTEYNNRMVVSSFMFRIDKLTSDLDALRGKDKGADWVNQMAGSLVHIGRNCPNTIVEKIQRMVRNRDSRIMKEREASDAEIEQMAIQKGKDNLSKPQYIEESIGILAGLSCLYQENSLRDLIVVDLQEKIRALEKIDVDSASFGELKYWSKWCSTFDSSFEAATSIVQEGIKLLNRDNLAQLMPLITENDEQKIFRNFVDSLG